MRRSSTGVALLFVVIAAGCSGGRGSGGTNGTPPPSRPSISYGATDFVFTTKSATTLIPTNTGGAATVWSVSPALPAGLSFDTATGAITGIAAMSAAPATYSVTAQNAGGSETVKLTLGVQSVLVDLVDADSFQSAAMSGSAILTEDNGAHWVIWDYTTGAVIQQGTVPCTPATCNGPVLHVELGGQTAVIQMPSTLAVYSAATGATLGVVPAIPTWWHVASDGSYVCGATSSAITAWSSSGSVIASRAGDYSRAKVFCKAGAMLVAAGPAGATVIETLSLPTLTSSVGPDFQGVFNSWFIDGSAFLTNVGTTVWVYSDATAQLDFASLTTVASLTGQGSWYWTNDYTQAGVGTVTIYKIGSAGTAAATYTFPVRSVYATGSGTTLGINDYSMGIMHVIDLSGAAPTDTQYTMPSTEGESYAAVSSAQWVAGNGYGVLVDGASLGGTPRCFNYGQAWSIAGGATRVAVATASGRTLIFDASSGNLVQTLNSSSSQIALSSDGTVLAARASGDKLSTDLDASVTVFSLPSGTVINTWPYTFKTIPWPMDITLSQSGKLLGQVIYSNKFSSSYARQVTASSGGPTLWSDTIVSLADPFLPSVWAAPILLSADDTLIAVWTPAGNSGGTNIYLNNVLATAVPGGAVSWLPNNDILQDLSNGEAPLTYAIYDSGGIKQSASPLSVDLGRVQALTADSVYDPGTNSIYSLTTGSVTWRSTNQSTGVGAVAGSNVVFATGSVVVMQPN